MQRTLPVVLIIAGILLIGSLVYITKMDRTEEMVVVTPQPQQEEQNNDNSRLVRPNPDAEIPESELKRISFNGKLQEVNTGCFVDAECYAVVDGKHVTAILGWTGGKVGSIEGVGDEGFGGLEKYIGQEVQVYAHEKADGTYTLYGAEEFYIKVK
jgi:hypothetical protein